MFGNRVRILNPVTAATASLSNQTTAINITDRIPFRRTLVNGKGL